MGEAATAGVKWVVLRDPFGVTRTTQVLPQWRLPQNPLVLRTRQTDLHD